jgi:hypothetical protein
MALVLIDQKRGAWRQNKRESFPEGRGRLRHIGRPQPRESHSSKICVDTNE